MSLHHETEVVISVDEYAHLCRIAGAAQAIARLILDANGHDRRVVLHDGLVTALGPLYKETT